MSYIIALNCQMSSYGFHTYLSLRELCGTPQRGTNIPGKSDFATCNAASHGLAGSSPPTPPSIMSTASRKACKFTLVVEDNLNADALGNEPKHQEFATIRIGLNWPE
jgi:hypothetical protein